MSAPVAVITCIGDTGNALQSARDRIHVAEELFPHRSEIDEMKCLSGIFVCDLQFSHLRGFLHIVEDRRIRLARLKVERSVFGLKDDIVAEVPVHRFELRHSLHHAVLAFVVGAIDKGAPYHLSTIGPQGVGEHVGSVGVTAVIVSRSGLSLAVGFDKKSTEVGDQLVDLPGLALPPALHGDVEGIGCPSLMQS